MAQTGKSRMFYGYWILAASMLALFIQSAAGFYSFGIFFKPVSEEFGWNREITSLAFLLLLTIGAPISPLIGRLTDRYGPKIVVIIGAFIMALGLFLTSLTNSLAIFYLGYAINGVGGAFLSMIPIGVLISKWFVKRRGMAVGITATGIGLAGFIMAPIIGNVFIPSFGWRTSYQILAVLSVVLVAVPIQLIVKRSPEEMGLYPDNASAPVTVKATEHAAPVSKGWGVKAALSTSTFWFIVGAYVLFGIFTTGASQHLVNNFLDIGFATATATAALSFVGLGSSVGKFSFGFACDYLSPKYCGAISFTSGIAALLLLTLPGPSVAIMLLLSFLLGLCIGGWVPVTTMMISANYGLFNYGQIYGIFTTFQGIAGGVGPTFFGYIYDTTGSYYPAYLMSIAALAVAIVLILATRRLREAQAPV